MGELAKRQAAGMSAIHGQMMDVGGGPWMISPNCKARWHNTLEAAQGRHRARGGDGRGDGYRTRCTCPRAKYLRAHHLRIRSERQKAARSTKAVGFRANLAREVAEAKPGMPDLRGGACATPGGRRIVDALAAKSVGSSEAHRLMCESCPVRLACAAWVVRDEHDDMPWAGVFGGLHHAERRTIRKRLAEQRQALKDVEVSA